MFKNSYNSIINKPNKSTWKWAKDINRHFSKENIPRNNRHMTRCSTSLVIKEIQIKTIMRYHLMPVRIAFIKKTKANKCWHGCREKRTTLHCWYKLVWPLWKTILRFLPKLKIVLRCAWAIPLLEIYTNDMKTPTWKISAHLCSE